MKLFLVQLALVSLIACLVAPSACELTTGDDGKPIAIQKLSSSDGKLYSMRIELDLDGQQSSLLRPIVAKMLLDTSRIRNWIAKPELARDNELWSALKQRGNHHYQLNLGNGLKINGSLVKMRSHIFGLTFDKVDMLVAREVRSDDNESTWQRLDFDGSFGPASLPFRPVSNNLGMSPDPATGIDLSVYSLHLNRTATDSETAGSLVVGGTDGRFYEGDIKYVPYIADSYDKFGRTNLIDISLKWEKNNHTESFNYGQELDFAHFDSTSPFIVGDAKVVDEFFASYLGATKVLDSYYMLSCDLEDKPNIIFKLGRREESVDLVLEPKDYVLRFNFTGSDLVCISAIRARRLVEPTYEIGNKISWSFGSILLKKYHTIYDYKHERLGIALSK